MFYSRLLKMNPAHINHRTSTKGPSLHLITHTHIVINLHTQDPCLTEAHSTFTLNLHTQPSHSTFTLNLHTQDPCLTEASREVYALALTQV